MNTVRRNKPLWKRIIGRWILPLLTGVVPAALAVLAAEGLIRGLGTLIEAVGARADWRVSSGIMKVGEIFGQLKTAEIETPWIAVGLICCLLALLTARLIRKRWVRALLWIFVMLLTIAGTLWFTEVNDIRFGAAIINLPVLMKSGML